VLQFLKKVNDFNLESGMKKNWFHRSWTNACSNPELWNKRLESAETPTISIAGDLGIPLIFRFVCFVNNVPYVVCSPNLLKSQGYIVISVF